MDKICKLQKRCKTRHHPFGIMFFLLWGVLGLSLLTSQVHRNNADHQWPAILWPGNGLDSLDTAGKFGYFWTAFSMILSACLFLISSPFYDKVKMLAFVRWVAIWVGLVTSISMAIAVPVEVIKGGNVSHHWWVAEIVWIVISAGFLTGLRLANSEFRANFSVVKEGR